jgi:hypothetical protein
LLILLILVDGRDKSKVAIEHTTAH